MIEDLAPLDSRMETNIVRADKIYRRKVLALSAAVGLLGTVVVLWVFPWWDKYVKGLNFVTAILVGWVIIIFFCLTLIPVGVYALRFGRKVVRYEQHPPPDVKVIVDTRLLRGHEARSRGRKLVVLSSLMIGLGTLGALVMVALSIFLML